MHFLLKSSLWNSGHSLVFGVIFHAGKSVHGAMACHFPFKEYPVIMDLKCQGWCIFSELKIPRILKITDKVASDFQLCQTPPPPQSWKSDEMSSTHKNSQSIIKLVNWIATSQDRFPPTGSFLEGKSQIPLFQENLGWQNMVFGQIHGFERFFSCFTFWKGCLFPKKYSESFRPGGSLEAWSSSWLGRRVVDQVI